MNNENKLPNTIDSDAQMISILADLGITEVSPETLKQATLNGDLLTGAKSVIDSSSSEEKPIH